MTTRVRIMSDLHIEFKHYQYEYFGEDIIILAGDIGVGLLGFNWIKNCIPEHIPVIYIAGNHEYYNQQIPYFTNALKIYCNSTQNIHFLENDTFIFNDIKFIGSTLWTDFNLFKCPIECMRLANNSMNDFVKIYLQYLNQLSAKDTLEFHKKSKRFIKNELKKTSSDLKTFLVTHHGPSIKSTEDKYKKVYLTAAFVSNLENFIKNNRIDYWIHGHCHSYARYILYNTEVICNPLGYPKEIDREYSPLIIEV